MMLYGWIKVDGTDIDYPFVQTTNNSYYLNHSFTKEENKSGWIFLDYRNNINNLDKNTIIYGHSRYDSSMFGSLRNSLKQSWFNNTENREIHLYTKAGDIVWQIFSVYHLPNTTDYLSTSFKDSSEFNSDIDISADDKIITLSTCYRLNDRMVMHGKLIK